MMKLCRKKILTSGTSALKETEKALITHSVLENRQKYLETLQTSTVYYLLKLFQSLIILVKYVFAIWFHWDGAKPYYDAIL